MVSTMAKQDVTQNSFIKLLADLTRTGKVEWARSTNEIGFVYCLTPQELIVFEVGDGNGLTDPTKNVAGIVSKCRNVSYLWLEPTPSFHDLLNLLRRAPIDDEKFIEFRRRAHLTPIQALEVLQ